MIRINLLRQNVLTGAATPHRLTITITACALFVLMSVGMGWWAWHLSVDIQSRQRQADRLQRETERLAEVQRQVTQFENLRRTLEERITVIERLKKNQTGPSSLLQAVRDSVPDRPTLWLTSLSQKGNGITIEGRSFDVPSIADFISELNRSRLFRSVELAYWQEEEQAIRFQLNCTTEQP